MNMSNLLWSAAAIVMLALPPYFLLSAPDNGGPSGAVRTINSYLKSAYAHDHKKAYRLISNRDRQIKSEDLYIQEKGPFSGFTLTVAGKLAEMIEVRPTGATESGATTKVKFDIKLPDASSLSALLLDWDQDKLNALPEPKQKEILAAIDNLRRAGKLNFIEGEEELTLVKENGRGASCSTGPPACACTTTPPCPKMTPSKRRRSIARPACAPTSFLRLLTACATLLKKPSPPVSPTVSSPKSYVNISIWSNALCCYRSN